MSTDSSPEYQATHSAVTTHTTETGHTVRPDPGDPGILACQQCPWQYPPAEPTSDDDGPNGEKPAPEADPGPVPDDQPEIPPLTLRDRIENAVERHISIDGERLDFTSTAQMLIDDVYATVAAGADWSDRTENAEMTPAQALAYLLDLPEWARLDRLASLLDAARDSRRCRDRMHDQIEAELASANQAQGRYRQALMAIGKLTAPLDTPLAEQIATLATEALVPE
jgi:hypothetical protein